MWKGFKKGKAHWRLMEAIWPSLQVADELLWRLNPSGPGCPAPWVRQEKPCCVGPRLLTRCGTQGEVPAAPSFGLHQCRSARRRALRLHFLTPGGRFGPLGQVCTGHMLPFGAIGLALPFVPCLGLGQRVKALYRSILCERCGRQKDARNGALSPKHGFLNDLRGAACMAAPLPLMCRHDGR